MSACLDCDAETYSSHEGVGSFRGLFRAQRANTLGRLPAIVFSATQGSFSPQAGSDVCQFCLPNSQSIPGSSSCKCNSGFYGDGQNTCLQCPLNTGSSEGSSLLSDCLCNAGFSGTSNNCEACLEGKFKETAGEMACSPCPEDHYSPASSTLSSACYAAPKVVFSFAMAGTVPCMMYSLRFLYFDVTIQLTRNE